LTVRVLLNGELMPADWKVARYFGEPVMIHPGDVLVFTGDRVVTEAEAPIYRDLIVSRSKGGPRT
jgi:signal peptidase I